MSLQNPDRMRLRIVITGAVQGVGFRPFIWRLASDLDLKGWVKNNSLGVVIEVDGESPVLDQFVARIKEEKPPLASLQSLELSFLDCQGFETFEIKESESLPLTSAHVLPDLATCPECLKEIFDSNNRRYLYPFTNCTHCGPRYSIIEALPYDRHNTTMKNFEMCEECQSEYDDPQNRRFHAQPNACPVCGPHLELWNSKGKVLASHEEALAQAIDAIKQGQVVALKGLGGFHLVVDSRNDEAIKILRSRKLREEKPFAVMFPDLGQVEEFCDLSTQEKFLLTSYESPIVIVPRKNHKNLSSLVAPQNPYLGVMLPYTPLHHILMKELGFPVVATSGNLSDEPICFEELEALVRLQGIADVFLVHNRPIVRPVDDSILKVVMNRRLMLRRSRGFAPLPLEVKKDLPNILAVGGQLKNTIALSIKNNVFISQHIGDLETEESLKTFDSTIKSFQGLYDVNVDTVASDLHPDYHSTKYAKAMTPTVKFVQHHHAHIAGCMVENDLEGEVLGVAWDGTGFGPDRTIWGGEFLSCDLKDFKRVASFRKFPLPGGAKSIKEPRRTAMGLLYELFQEKLDAYEDLPCFKSFTEKELDFLKKMLTTHVNSPLTSSVGRLFDAVTSIIGLHQSMNFEGQAAMTLEYALQGIDTQEKYSYDIIDAFANNQRKDSANEESLIIDWGPLIREIIRDYQEKVVSAVISAKFHNTLVEMILDVAKRCQQKRVVLSGGCFQNKYLTEKAIERLQKEDFSVYWHQRVPPNDGGIALGQIVVAGNS